MKNWIFWDSTDSYESYVVSINYLLKHLQDINKGWTAIDIHNFINESFEVGV